MAQHNTCALSPRRAVAVKIAVRVLGPAAFKAKGVGLKAWLRPLKPRHKASAAESTCGLIRRLQALKAECGTRH